jgi:large subunit ribosomal protein L30
VLQKTEESNFQKYLTANIMAKIKITQVKSTIDRSQRQKDTIKALGILKVNRSVEKRSYTTGIGYGSKSKTFSNGRKYLIMSISLNNLKPAKGATKKSQTYCTW